VVPFAFHTGEVGLDYTPVSLGATGGTGTYRWSIGGGSFPPGLMVEANGQVVGTPASAGNFSFSLDVADFGSSTASAQGTIRILPAVTAGLVAACVTKCQVELGCVNVCGTFGRVSGGLAPYTFHLKSGPLPSGTTLSGLSVKGTFTGLPGLLQFTVVVTDKLGATASISPTFNIFRHISLASGECYGDYPFSGCTARLKITGGTPGVNPTLKVTSIGPSCTPTDCRAPYGTLPSGAFTVGGGYVTVTIPVDNGFSATVTVVLTDRSLCSAGVYCTSAPATIVISG